MKKIFINFSGSVNNLDLDLVNRQKLLNLTASQFANIDKTIAWTRDDLLETEFYKNNKIILDNPRGSGYWAWKPYIILETLKKSNPDDWVIYCDVGKPFRRGSEERAGNNSIGNAIYTPVDALIDYAQKNQGFTPGVWIPHYGLAHIWTKRDCFVGMDCDSSEYHYSPHIQAGSSAWSNSDESIAILTEWLKWCCDPKIISDDDNTLGKPNSKRFRDHRHDQAILSNLVVKNRIKPFGPKERSLNGYRNFNLILRHMMLSNSHLKLKQRFSQLFKSQPAELPKFIQEISELLFLCELKDKPKVLLQSDLDVLTWQKALPNATFDLFTDEINLKNHANEKKYDGIFITRAQQKLLTISLFGTLYQALKPGGFLTIGPYQGTKNESPSLEGHFSQFIAWLGLHQRLPDNCGIKEDQRKNALTSGSIVNPLVIYLNNNSCFVAIVKPKIYLVENL